MVLLYLLPWVPKPRRIHAPFAKAEKHTCSGPPGGEHSIAIAHDRGETIAISPGMGHRLFFEMSLSQFFRGSYRANIRGEAILDFYTFPRGKLSQLSVRNYESQKPVTALTRSPRRFPLSGEAIAQYPSEAIASSPEMGYRHFSK